VNPRPAQSDTGQRVAATVRCVVLLTVVVMSEVVRLSGEGSLGMDITLAAGTFYILITTFFPHRLLLPTERSRGLMVATDVLFVTMLIWFGGRMQSQYYLLYYLPVLHASLRLNFRDAITSSMLAAVCYLFVGVSSGFDEPIITSAFLRVAAFGASALVLAVFFALLAGEARTNRRLAASLQQAIESLRAVYDVARAANNADTLQEVLDALLAQACRMVSAEGGFIALRDGEGELQVTAALTPPQSPEGLPQAAFDRELAAQARKGTPVAQVETAPPSPEAKPRCWRTALCVPLQSAAETLGVLQLWSAWEKPFSKQEVDLVAALCAEVAVAVENARLRTELRHAASTDPLTGLLNRNEFHQRLVTEVKRAERHGHPLSLVLLDIDDFKACNDTCGHAAGDQVLRTLATVIKDSIRAEDVAGRYGGDEFMILLPHTDDRGAHAVADALRKRFNERLFTTDGAIYKVTLSAGVAAQGREPSATLIMRKADRALFQAKQAGKNQVSLWTGGDVPDDLISPIRHDA